MLAGLSREEKQKLDISDASKYQYLTGVNNIFIPNFEHFIGLFLMFSYAINNVY